MSHGGGIDQQYICCSQCHGLFTRRKTLLHHKSICNGDPSLSKCDFYAVPYSEFKEWKDSKRNKKGSARKSEAVVQEVKPRDQKDEAKDPQDKSPKQPRPAVAAIQKKEESPFQIPRKRGRPRKTNHVVVISETRSNSANIEDEADTKGNETSEKSHELEKEYVAESQSCTKREEFPPKESSISSSENKAVRIPNEIRVIEDNTQGRLGVQNGCKEADFDDHNKSSSPETSQNGYNRKETTKDDEIVLVTVSEGSSEPATSRKNVILSPGAVGEDTSTEIAVQTAQESEHFQSPDTEVIMNELANEADDRKKKVVTAPSDEDACSESLSLFVSRKKNGIYECSICEYKTRLRGMYVRHMQSHNFGDRFNCNVCGRMFLHRRHFNAHMLTHNKLQCPHCDKNYSRPHDRDRHIKNVHSEEKTLFSCSSCSFSTPYPGNYKEHLRKHTGERLFCPRPDCEYKTLYQRALRHHLNSVHATSKDFKCPLCSYESSTKLGLTKHMITHSSIRSKKCPHCPYTAKTNGSLQVHLLKHGSEKYYYCDQCSYKTFRSHSFRNHMLFHLGLKPWYCGICNFDAVTKEKVVRHLATKHHIVTKNRSHVRKKDIRVKLNLEAFSRDPSVATEQYNSTDYDNSKMVMIEVINESGENVQANFSPHHKIILNNPNNADEVAEQVAPNEIVGDYSGDIYKCAMCPYQADNLGDVEEHINEQHNSVTGEEIVMNFEETAMDGAQHFDISQGNVEIQEATDQEVEEMVYVIEAPDLLGMERQPLIIPQKSTSIPDDDVYTAVESILHLKNPPEIVNNTLVSSKVDLNVTANGEVLMNPSSSSS